MLSSKVVGDFQTLRVLVGLAAASGGEGHNQLLLWNIFNGELAPLHLNAGYRLLSM